MKVAGSQKGFATSSQFAFARHVTQAPVEAQKGPRAPNAAMHSWREVHAMHCPPEHSGVG